MSIACKHFQQYRKDSLRTFWRDDAKLANQTLPVNRSDLIKCNLATSSLERNADTCRIGPFGGRHRSNNNGIQVFIGLIRRNYQARPGLLDFRALSGVQRYEPNLIPSRWVHQVHSSASNSFGGRVPNSGGSTAQEPAAIKDSLQPWRGWRSGAMINLFCSMCSSIVSLNPHCSMRGFGMRIPRELPIRTSSILISTARRSLVITL